METKNRYWLKLWRKIDTSDVFFDDKGLRLFIWLLTHADKDTGKITIGRYVTSPLVKMKPTTFYKVLKRLEKKYKIVNLVTKTVTNKYTEVSLVNWKKYQSGNQLSNNEVTMKGQSSNTIQEVKNIRIKEIDDDEKIPNRLILSRGQLIAFAKEFRGITTEEIKEQREKCNAYMNMSSQTYKNVGLFFRKWLEQYQKDKREKITKEKLATPIDLPDISEKERQRNLLKLSEMRKSLNLGVNR